MKWLRTISLCFFIVALSACSSIVVPTPTSSPRPTETYQPTYTPTQSATSTLTATPTTTPTITPIPISYKPMGVIQRHDPNDEIKYTWFSYVPSTIKLMKESEPINILIVCANATMSGDYSQAIKDMQGCINGRIDWALFHNYILLTPVIPRDLHTPIYAVAFDKRVFTKVEYFYQRPDLEVVKMLELLKKQLNEGRIIVEEQIFIEGFSAGGMFAQRFTLLHPEIVKAIAVGQCGGALTLPVDEYDGRKMDWPLGISDYEELTGYPFNIEAYKSVKQFIYIGSEDNKNSTVHYGNEIWTNRQVDILNSFGKTDPARIEKQVEYLTSNGFENILFKLYPEYRHEYYPDQIDEIFTFFEENK